MIKISKRQMKVIDVEVEAAYAREMAEYLRHEHGADVAALSDAALLRRVTIAIERARSYGLTWDTSITAFVAIMLTVAPNFDEHPAIHAVLRDESVPPNLRIDALFDDERPRTTDEDWEEAAASASEGYWQAAERAQEAAREGIDR